MEKCHDDSHVLNVITEIPVCSFVMTFDRSKVEHEQINGKRDSKTFEARKSQTLDAPSPDETVTNVKVSLLYGYYT